MQNTLPLTPGNPLRNTTGLARQIALPGEHAPLRFPSFPALERTAVMGFNQPSTLVLKANTPTPVTLFRQATFPVWADRSVGFFQAMGGKFDAVPSLAGGASDITLFPRGVAFWTNKDTISDPQIPSYNSTPNPLSPFPIIGRDLSLAGTEWLYVPDGLAIGGVISLKTTIAVNTYLVVNVEIWRSPGQVYTTSFNLTVNSGQKAGYGSLMNSGACWVRIRELVVLTVGGPNIPDYWNLFTVGPGSVYSSSTTDAGTLVYGSSSQPKHLPLVFPTEFSNSALPWYASKVTAAAFLGTNVSQVLNKGGTVLGGRVSPAVFNAWDVTEDYINGLHPAEKAFLPLETGVYTYAPPSTDLATFSDYTLNTGEGALSAPVFILSNDALYNKMYITAAGVDESLACTSTWHLEFRTSSSLFQIGLSPMTLESLHGAQLTLAEAGFFFENPEHDKLLNRVIAGAKKFAPAIAGAAGSTVNPGLGKMMHSMVSRVLMPRSGPSKPPATSAKASGITAPTRKPKSQSGKAKPPKGKQQKRKK